jgi:tetratricopeptide (TPR) repeat protein
MELARTAPGEGDLFVVPVRYLEKQNAGKPKEVSSLFGANLILTLDLARLGKAVELVLRLVRSSTGELLRGATVSCLESALPTLRVSAFERAAALLDIPRRNLRPEVTGGDTTNADAYAAYERARGLLRGFGLPSVDQAIEELQKAVDLDRRFARAWAKLGEAYATRFQLTKDAAALELAERTNKKALELAPELSACYAGRAQIELYRGEYDAAIRDSEEATKLDPDGTEVRIRLAETYLKSGELRLAAQTYEQLAADRPNDWFVLNDWGDFDIDQANYVEAEKLFHQATILAPQAALPWGNLGAVYLAMGRLDDADLALNKSIALLPSGEAYANLGTALFWQAKYRQAAEAYLKAVGLDPLQHLVWRNLGDAYQAMGFNAGKAAAAWQKAADLAVSGLQVNPRSTDLLTSLALYKAKLGETKEALALLKRAGTFPAATVEERFNEALAYELAGNRAEALQLLDGCVRDGYSRTDLDHAPELQNLRKDSRFQAVAMKAKEK